MEASALGILCSINYLAFSTVVITLFHNKITLNHKVINTF